MSKLQIEYSKEFANELGKIAVYLPGEDINVGDIVTFPNGKTILGKPRPLGTFKKISSLGNLGISFPNPVFSKTPDTYRFTSKNKVDFNFDVDGETDLKITSMPNAKTNLKIKFSSEGAIYFHAIDCDKKELNDLSALENEINAKGKKLLWDDTFLVTSVTIAKKAFIVQSKSKNSEVSLKGDFNGIQTSSTEITASSSFQIEKQHGDIFIKDWSDDVTVFIDLVRFEKKVFEESYRGSKTKSKKSSKIYLKPVLINELLID